MTADAPTVAPTTVAFAAKSRLPALVVAAGSVLGCLIGAVVSVPLTAVTWAVFSTWRTDTAERGAGRGVRA